MYMDTNSYLYVYNSIQSMYSIIYPMCIIR
jgi:hypothetical protein